MREGLLPRSRVGIPAGSAPDLWSCGEAGRSFQCDGGKLQHPIDFDRMEGSVQIHPDVVTPVVCHGGSSLCQDFSRVFEHECGRPRDDCPFCLLSRRRAGSRADHGTGGALFRPGCGPLVVRRPCIVQGRPRRGWTCVGWPGTPRRESSAWRASWTSSP
jgi:hypothetical protein